MTFHSLTVPTQHIHTKGRGQGPQASGPKVVGEQPSAGPQPNSQGTSEHRGVEGPHQETLPWTGVEAFFISATQHQIQQVGSPDLILLRELTPPWLMETPGFHLNLPPLMDCGSSPQTPFSFLRVSFDLHFLGKDSYFLQWGEDPHLGAGGVSVWMYNSLEISRLQENEPMSQLEGNLSVPHSQDLRIF